MQFGEIVKLDWGKDTSIAVLADSVRVTVGLTGDNVYDHSKHDCMPRKLMDTSRLEGLGWTPSKSLEEGIAESYR